MTALFTTCIHVYKCNLMLIQGKCNIQAVSFDLRKNRKSYYLYLIPSTSICHELQVLKSSMYMGCLEVAGQLYQKHLTLT